MDLQKAEGVHTRAGKHAGMQALFHISTSALHLELEARNCSGFAHACVSKRVHTRHGHNTQQPCVAVPVVAL